MNNINDFGIIYVFSPFLRQDLYQKLTKCFSNFIPTNIIQEILNEEDIDLLIEEIVNDKNSEKSQTEIETYEPMKEIKYPQEYISDQQIVIILDDLNEKELNDLRVQAMFKRSRHSNISIFIISQDCYDLPKRTNRANGNRYHIFKPKIF